jgi:hypothetical protein
MAITVNKENCVGCEPVWRVSVGAIGMTEESRYQSGHLHQWSLHQRMPCRGDFARGSHGSGTGECRSIQDICVYTELENGEPCHVSYELIGQAADLRGKRSKTCAVLICKEAGALPRNYSRRSGHRLRCADSHIQEYNNEL